MRVVAIKEGIAHVCMFILDSKFKCAKCWRGIGFASSYRPTQEIYLKPKKCRVCKAKFEVLL